MSAKHTPGPWSVEQQCENSLSVVVGDLEVCAVIAENQLTDEDRANASLIAAAPDLLEALRDARYALMQFTGGDKVAKECRERKLLVIDAAIEKATQ